MASLFPKRRLCILLHILTIFFSESSLVFGARLDTETKEDDASAAAAAAVPAVRIVTKAELATKNETELWLAILGEVYNVTAGSQYYKKGATYHVFVGRDGSSAFITGNFSAEAAEKSVYESLNDMQLSQLETWREFYATEDKYPFVGLLEGELYDKDGNPTEERKRVEVAIAEGKVKMEEQKKKQKEIAAKRKKEAAEKKAAEEKAKQKEQEL